MTPSQDARVTAQPAATAPLPVRVTFGNRASAIGLVLCALAVVGAIEMILELAQPFTGMIRISPLQLRGTVAALGQ